MIVHGGMVSVCSEALPAVAAVGHHQEGNAPKRAPPRIALVVAELRLRLAIV